MLVEVVGSLLLFVITLVILVWLSPLLSLVMLVSVPILVVVVAALRQALAPRVPRAPGPRRGHDVVAAGRAGRRPCRAVVQPRERPYASYRGRSRAQVSAWRRISLVNIGFFPLIAFAQSLALAAVLVVGGYLERHGRVSVGTVVAFALYLISLFDPIARLGDWFSEFQSGRAALTKIFGLLDEPVTVGGGPRRCPATGALVADGRHVRLRRRAPAVVGVTLAIEPGEHLALVGATGAGKSTLAKLLVRAYDPGEGAVRYGGVDLRDAPLDELRAAHRLRAAGGPSVLRARSPTTFGSARPEAGDDEVRAALRAIGALERFEALPEGLATDVQSRGVRLSSGERQLVSIARVALVDPAVIVLDEATSSLDPQTEAAVEQALAALARGRTVITIAHRLSTAERADRVAVMEHARLVEVASHDELVANGDRYARLWASWQAGLVA